MNIEENLQRTLCLIKEEDVLKSKKDFLGLIKNYNEQIILDNSIGCYILYYCKAYCYIRLGKKEEAKEIFKNEKFKQCATLIGGDVIRYATASICIFMYTDFKILDSFHINTIKKLLDNPDSSQLLKRIVFDYEELINKENAEKKISENETYNPNKLLQDSVKSFQNKQNRLPTISELEAEVINCACLYILKKHPTNIKQVNDINLIYNVSEHNLTQFRNTASDFTNAAISLFPNHYNEDLAYIGNISIINNISWSGMFDFLRVYYNDVHGIKIDNQSVN